MLSQTIHNAVCNCPDHNRILQQLDTTTTDLNSLQQNYDVLLSRHNQMRTEVETSKAEVDANKKKVSLKEKQLKARENAISARESNQNERDESIVLLKGHVKDMEQKIIDVEELCNNYKLKLLTSEDVRMKQSSEPPNGKQLPACQHATPSTQVDMLQSTLQTSLLITAASMLANRDHPPPSSQTPIKVININHATHQHRRHQQHYKHRNVYHYNHGKHRYDPPKDQYSGSTNFNDPPREQHNTPTKPLNGISKQTNVIDSSPLPSDIPLDLAHKPTPSCQHMHTPLDLSHTARSANLYE